MSLKRIITTGFGAVLFLQLSCKDRGVEPPPPKDPRTYTWTIDTLAYPGSFQTAMQDIWASSSTNVYIVGHNDQPGPGTMFRFDGTEWRTTGFHAGEGGPISGPVSLTAIYGFSADNIFAVGERIYQNPNPPPNFLDSSLIIHFDGVQWSEQRVFSGRRLYAVHGSSPNDVWATGAEGTAYHYDGSTWTMIPMNPTEEYLDVVAFSPVDVYVRAAYGDLIEGYYVFLHFNGTRWDRVDSVHVTSFSAPYKLSHIGSTLYYLGYGIWIRQGNSCLVQR